MSRCFLFLAILMLSGCATYRAREVEIAPIYTYQVRGTTGEVTLACDPYLEKEKIKSAFYINLAKKDVTPINLIFENQGKTAVFIKKTQIRLEDSSGNIYEPLTSEVVINKFEKKEILYAASTLLYMTADNANEKMREDWLKKELGDEVLLMEGKSVSGFLFFEISPADIKPGEIKIIAEVETYKKDGTLRFTLPFE